LACSLAVAAAEAGVREKIGEGGCEGERVVGRDDQAGFAVLDHFGQGADVAGYHGDAMHEGFDGVYALGLAQGGEGEDGTAQEEAADFGERDAAEDFDVGQVDGGRGAGDDETGGGEGLLDLAEGLDEDGAAFSLPVDPDEEDGLVRVVGVVERRGGRREIGGGADDGDLRGIAMVIADEGVADEGAHDKIGPDAVVEAGLEFDPAG
jgi:hypothetical protein